MIQLQVGDKCTLKASARTLFGFMSVNHIPEQRFTVNIEKEDRYYFYCEDFPYRISKRTQKVSRCDGSKTDIEFVEKNQFITIKSDNTKQILSEKPIFWQWHVWDTEKGRWFFCEDVVVETPDYEGCVHEANQLLSELFPRFCQKYNDRRAIPCVPDEDEIIIGKEMCQDALRFERDGREYCVSTMR